MNKEEREIIKLIEKMEDNYFLLADGYTYKVDMMNEDWSYTTYVGGRGESRYMHFEKNLAGKNIYKVMINKDKVSLDGFSISDKLEPNELLNFFKAIYKEKHSFKNHSEGKKKIRKSIREKLYEKEKIENELEDLKKQLKDAGKLKK